MENLLLLIKFVHIFENFTVKFNQLVPFRKIDVSANYAVIFNPVGVNFLMRDKWRPLNE
jgi:hypothetical protein